jgi:putative two-component system response regulator
VHHDGDIDVLLLTPGDNLRPYTELCRQIKFDARTAFMSVLFALTPAHADYRSDILVAGADECIQLPAAPEDVLLRLANLSRMKHMADSLEDATAVISSLATAIEGRDAYTRGHVERVSTYALEVGRRLGMDDAALAALRLGGVVHDIGKVAIPDHVLNKAGKLSTEEMELIKRHPVIGYDILRPSRTFRAALPAVRWHHERPNGQGYPDGLAGDRIPLVARIVAVADVFDAISTPRPYRVACPPPQCRQILTSAAKCGDLDPELVRILLALLEETNLLTRADGQAGPRAGEPADALLAATGFRPEVPPQWD